jgi:hypothetical protein
MRTAMVILATALVIALLLVAGKFFVSSDSFGLTNPSWDGISSLALNDRTMPIYDFGQLRQAGPGDTLLIVGPSTAYSAQEASDVSYFMLNGGRTIVMDDYGTGDTLLRYLNSPVNITHVPLCQDIDYYRSPALPVIKDVANDSITSNISELTFNHAVPLQMSGDAVPLASTSTRAWLDLNDNSTLDGNETFGSYTLVAQAGYGKGELIVAGDADLLINGMLRKGDNGRLLDNIMDGGHVYLDAGHGQQVPPLAGLYFLVKYNTIVQVVCVIVILAIAYASVRWRLPRKERKKDSDGQADSRRSLIAAMRAGMPLSERDIKVINKKL